MPGRSDATLKRALDLVGRPDSHLSGERVRSLLDSGAWALETFVDLLETHAEQRPESPAVVDQDGTATSWRELSVASTALACALEDRGYGPGDVLGVQLPNWSELVVTVLGAARLGVRPAFVHMPYRAFEMEYILGLTEARGLVVPGTYRGTDNAALALEIARRLPSLRDVITVRSQPVDGTVALASLLESGRDQSPVAAAPLSSDLFVLLFTSGTTNRPKGVMHLHANLLTACRNYVEDFSLGPDDRWLVVTPLSHLTAFGIALLTGAMAAGGTVVLLESWNVDEALALAERHRVTHLVGAPPMLVDMARSPALDDRELSCLRFVMYAGAPCPIEILRRLQSRVECDLAVFYGWTEGLAHTYSVPEDPLEVTSVTVGRTGRGWEWRVVDDSGEDVGVGERGEFWGRGPNLSPGYFRQPQFMSARFHPDGWFMSGDVVTRNADGTFTFVSRSDDVINRGGQKLDPREVEELIYEMDEVADAAVVAVPDERLGERGCLFVVPAPGAAVTLDRVREHLEARGLAKFKWPERLEVVGALPMTATAKVMRYALRERAAQKG